MRYAQSTRVSERNNGKGSKFFVSSFRVSQIRCRFCVVSQGCVFLMISAFSGMHQLVFRISEVLSKVRACQMEAFLFSPRVAVRIFAFDVFLLFQIDAFLSGNHGKHQVR